MPRESVTVVEVGLRDGLQMLPQVVPTERKIAWLDAERSAGVCHFEAASFVPPKLLPQMADAAAVVRHAKRHPDLMVSALVPNLKGALAALEAGADMLVVPVSASEGHSRANVRRTPDEMVAELRRICEARRATGRNAKVYAGIATAFGCTIQGAVSEDEVVRIASGCAEAGADEMGLADTVGYANPTQVRRLFAHARREIGHRVNSAHFHDTRGTGLANVAALDAGIRSFDASLGGLGGCPYAPGASGNIATEDLVFMLEAMGLDTGISLDRLIEAQRKLATLLPGQIFHGKVAAAGIPKNRAA
jgi:hydroxymethylglutaryl-CoA lyase